MNPDALFSAVAGQLRGQMPPGLVARDLDGFLARKRGRLVVRPCSTGEHFLGIGGRAHPALPRGVHRLMV